jgi:ABC-type multidrug transport system fused ATPase/permease subunit
MLTVVGALVGLAQPWPLALVIDDVILGSKGGPPWPLHPLFGNNPDPYRLLAFIVGFGFLVSVMDHGVRVVSDYVNAKIEQNMVLNLRSDLFNHVTQLSLTYHDERHTGMLMSLINNQASSLGAIVMTFPPLFESFLMLIGMLVIAMLIDWQVTLVSLVCVPFLYWAIGLYGTRIVPRIQRVQSLELRSLSIVFEAMSMLRVIVSFGRRRLEHYRFTTQGKTAVDARVRLTVHQTMFSLGVATAIALGSALVLGFGAYHVLEGYITLGELTVLIAYIHSVYQPLEQISQTIGHLHQSFVYLNASMAILAEAPEVEEPADALDIGRSSGSLEFDDVSFSYKGRRDTLRNISFKCEGGSRVAIVGPTGAGKTTLINLLVRFYDPAEGVIRIDGHDTKQMKLDSLRAQLSLVLQQPLLFSGTISDNIRYGKLDATMDEIVDAAKAANCHDFISTLPEGYETILGEGGAQLSGGERQRICVARAFIRDAPILILDEPTSSIDSKTESVILDALENLMVGRTSFMIAHRLSTVRTADLILVLNHGKLVEQGTHEQLLLNKGLYYQLYEAQTGRAAAIEAQYAQNAIAGESEQSVSDIIAELATAEALARYEGDEASIEQVPAPHITDHHENGDDGAPPPAVVSEPDEPLRPPGLWAPIVPQPNGSNGSGNGAHHAPPAAPAHETSTPEPEPVTASAARPAGDVPEQQAPTPPAPAEGSADERTEVTEKVIETLTDAVRQRIRAALEDGKTAPENGAEGNGAHRNASPQHPAGDDPGV